MLDIIGAITLTTLFAIRAIFAQLSRVPVGIAHGVQGIERGRPA